MSTALFIPASEPAFELIGHDCPLGEYPAVLVPIGNLAGHFVAVYTGAGGIEFHTLEPRSLFFKHSEDVARTLAGFDPHKQGLFGLSENDILTYDLGKEERFYGNLLRSSAAFTIEPFYRLSLAIETNEPALIRTLYRRCVRQLQRHTPELVETLVLSIPAPTDLVAAIQREVLREINEPHAVLSQVPASIHSAAAQSAFSTAEPQQLDISPSPGMNSTTIETAVRAITSQETLGSSTWNDVHALALRTSLGIAGPHQQGNAVPSARDVAETSKLSLSHLEFKKILLSKESAIEFLNRSISGISPEVLSRDLLNARSYNRQFLRPPTKVRQRTIFTYAEVLSLIRYTDTVELT